VPDPSNATAAPVENGGFVWKVGGRAASFPSAIPDSVIENWERSSPLDAYSGQFGSLTVDTNASVVNGSYSAKRGSGTGPSFWSTAGDGLDYYPEVGTPHQVAVQAPNGDAGIHGYFAGTGDLAGSGDGYHWTTWWASDEVQLYRRDGGSATTLDSATGVGLPSAEWVSVKTRHQSDGTLDVVWLDSSGSEIAALSDTDSTYISNDSYDAQCVGLHTFEGGQWVHDFHRPVEW